MAVLDPLALDGASDVQIQTLLTGQQSPVARCKTNFQKNSHFLRRISRYHLREHSSSTIIIELGVAHRTITANTKVRSHRRRTGMILAFARRVASPRRIIPSEARSRAQRRASSARTRRLFSVSSSFSSSRDLLSRYTASRSEAWPFRYISPEKMLASRVTPPRAFALRPVAFARKKWRKLKIAQKVTAERNYGPRASFYRKVNVSAGIVGGNSHVGGGVLALHDH